MQKSFRGALEAAEFALSSTIVRIPFDPTVAWPVRSKLRVRGSIRPAQGTAEAFSFSTSLMNTQKLGYFLLVTGKMRKAARVELGTRVEITLEPDLEGQAAIAPPELAKLLRADRSVKKWYEQLNYSMRKYMADAVNDGKSTEVRVRRAEQWVETMMLAMEGEIEPPPILQIAFRRQPLARIGWDAMTPIQRRNQLLGIFQCKGPDARAKRVEWTVAEAIKIANRIAGRESGSKPALDSEQ
jgi:uncharacterized protein YdeI (YjbR/CyaY-like superfamily)